MRQGEIEIQTLLLLFLYKANNELPFHVIMQQTRKIRVLREKCTWYRHIAPIFPWYSRDISDALDVLRRVGYADLIVTKNTYLYRISEEGKQLMKEWERDKKYGYKFSSHWVNRDYIWS